MDNEGYKSDSQESYATAISQTLSNSSTTVPTSLKSESTFNFHSRNSSKSNDRLESSNFDIPDFDTVSFSNRASLSEHHHPILSEPLTEDEEQSETISIQSEENVSVCSISTTTANPTLPESEGKFNNSYHQLNLSTASNRSSQIYVNKVPTTKEASGHASNVVLPPNKNSLNKFYTYQPLNLNLPKSSSGKGVTSTSKTAPVSNSTRETTLTPKKLNSTERSVSNLSGPFGKVKLPSLSNINRYKKFEKSLRDYKSKYSYKNYFSNNYIKLFSTKEIKLLRDWTLLLSNFCNILCLFLPMIVAFLVPPGGNTFSWHPFLMTTAYSFINLQAILLFAPENLNANAIKTGYRIGGIHNLGTGAAGQATSNLLNYNSDSTVGLVLKNINI